MPVIYPEGVTAQGNVKVIFVARAGVADPEAPTVAELTAATAVDASFILQEGSWAPTAEPNRGTAPRRLGSKKQFETFGTVTEAVPDLMYVVDPQAIATADGKKLYTLLAEGGEFYGVERLGLDAETVDITAAQLVNLHPIKVGPRPINGDTADEFAEFVVKQAVAVQAPGVYRDIAVVA